MEKDIDEVGKIARLAKTKVDELEKDVCSCLTLILNNAQFCTIYKKTNWYVPMIGIIKISYYLVSRFADKCKMKLITFLFFFIIWYFVSFFLVLKYY
jgi:hypothetical protein